MHIYKGTTGPWCFILRETDAFSEEKLVRLPCAYLQGNTTGPWCFILRGIDTLLVVGGGD